MADSKKGWKRFAVLGEVVGNEVVGSEGELVVMEVKGGVTEDEDEADGE